MSVLHLIASMLMFAADGSAPAIRLLKTREPNVKWRADSLVVADVTLDGVPDVVVLGVRGDAAVVGLVAGPVKAKSKHWTLAVPYGPGSQDGLSGKLELAALKLEGLGLPLDEWGCGPKEKPSDECAKWRALDKKMTDAAKKGSKGVALWSPDVETDAFHLFFDGEALMYWRR